MVALYIFVLCALPVVDLFTTLLLPHTWLIAGDAELPALLLLILFVSWLLLAKKVREGK